MKADNKVRAQQAAEVAQSGRLPRREKNKLLTRAKLLRSAYEVMSRDGVDAARIQDITEMADIGFGTFYNYFESKEDLARQVLDCMIDAVGRRNVQATAGLPGNDPAQVIAGSISALMQVATADPIWRWWAMRPLLLVERLRAVIGRYAARDSAAAASAGAINVADGHFAQAWYVTSWIIAGSVHDIVSGQRPPDHLAWAVKSAMQLLGAPDVALPAGQAAAHLVAEIDWTFRVEAIHDQAA